MILYLVADHNCSTLSDYTEADSEGLTRYAGRQSNLSGSGVITVDENAKILQFFSKE